MTNEKLKELDELRSEYETAQNVVEILNALTTGKALGLLSFNPETNKWEAVDGSVVPDKLGKDLFLKACAYRDDKKTAIEEFTC